VLGKLGLENAGVPGWVVPAAIVGGSFVPLVLFQWLRCVLTSWWGCRGAGRWGECGVGVRDAWDTRGCYARLPGPG
jgi:hypothetical protein